MRVFSQGVVLALLLAGCSATHSPISPAHPGKTDPHTVSQQEQSSTIEGNNSSTDDWEKIREEDGIFVYRKEVEGSPLVAFRGDGVVEAPLPKVALVQMNLDRVPEWVERMKESRVLEVLSDKDFLTYSHLGAPPLVSDRDFVNRIEIEYDAPSRIKFNMHSVDDPKAPPTAGVRGRLLHSSFELTALSPDRTRVVCEIHADPMGSLPKWVVNKFQKGWAFKTISQLRKQVQKNDLYERAPEIRDLLLRHGYSL